MKRALTYKEFTAVAMANYAKGGDCIVECWDELAFNYYVKEFGPVTYRKLMGMISMYKSVEDESASYEW